MNRPPFPVFLVVCFQPPYMPTEQSARSARSNGIASGVRTRPSRKTRAEKVRETDVKFGLIKQDGR